MRHHLARHYRHDIPRGWSPEAPGMLGFLTECRLAEIHQATGASEETRLASARRVIYTAEAAGVTDPSQLPALARATYNQCRRLVPPAEPAEELTGWRRIISNFAVEPERRPLR